MRSRPGRIAVLKPSVRFVSILTLVQCLTYFPKKMSLNKKFFSSSEMAICRSNLCKTMKYTWTQVTYSLILNNTTDNCAIKAFIWLKILNFFYIQYITTVSAIARVTSTLFHYYIFKKKTLNWTVLDYIRIIFCSEINIIQFTRQYVSISRVLYAYGLPLLEINCWIWCARVSYYYTSMLRDFISYTSLIC